MPDIASDIPPELLKLLLEMMGRQTPADALQTIPGRGIGTPPSPRTSTDPISEVITNILGAIQEGSALPMPDIGFENMSAEQMWDPRLLGVLAGIAGVLEPGPDLPVWPVQHRKKRDRFGRHAPTVA